MLGETIDDDKVITSEDTKRSNRIPPGQIETNSFPVLHYGEIPQFNPETWDFCIFGLVEESWKIGYSDFMKLPTVRVKADFHCVTSWSKLDSLWEGVTISEMMKHIKLKAKAKFVMAHCEYGFTTNLSLDYFLKEDVLLAYRHNGNTLTAEHGYPLRLVVPLLYAWKSAKWIRGFEFMDTNKPGFWERNGYHMNGNPWKEERFGSE